MIRVGERARGDMPLHRDIYWLGRQWTVTGFGIQAVNRKFDMRFDVEASRLWQQDLDAPMRQLDWFDPSDFAKALEIARHRARETPAIFSYRADGERGSA